MAMSIIAKLRAQPKARREARSYEAHVTLRPSEFEELERSAKREGLSRMATMRAAFAFYSRFFRDPGVQAAMKAAEDA